MRIHHPERPRILTLPHFSRRQCPIWASELKFATLFGTTTLRVMSALFVLELCESNGHGPDSPYHARRWPVRPKASLLKDGLILEALGWLRDLSLTGVPDFPI